MDPSESSIEVFSNRIEKTHSSRYLFDRELLGYSNCYWASPLLLGVDMVKKKLVIEKCTPLIELPPDRDHAVQAWDKLLRLHDTGWNHRDASVYNMVLHPTRGVLLVDWESVWRVTVTWDSLSYDLYGATNTYVPPEEVPEAFKPDGVWWGAGRWHDPGNWWGVSFSAG